MKNFVFGGVDKAKTFRPKRNHRVGTKRYELHKHAQATLGTGNLHEAVTLPEGEDENEWLAVNTVDFFNEINLLYGVIAEFCTERFGVTFPMFEKISVKGDDMHPLYKDITALPKPVGEGPNWNFTKYLVDREGNAVARYAPGDKPGGEKVMARLSELLGEG